MQNSKTQKYKDKYCECIDQLVEYWQNGGEKRDISKLACRANFFHLALGIDEKISRFHGELISPNIHDFYYDFKDFEHDPSYTKRMKEQIPLREQHVLECKALALQISSPIKEIESGPYNGPATQEGLEELRDSLKHMKKAMLNHMSIDPIEGRNANRLVVEMGLASKWLKTAKDSWLTEAKNLPYQINPTDRIANVLTENGEPLFEHGHSNMDRIEKWIEKTEKKLVKINSKQNIANPRTQEEMRDDYYLEHPEYITLTDASINYGFTKSLLHKYSQKKPGEVNHLWSIKPQKHRFFKKKDIVKLAESRNKLAINFYD